MYNPDKSGHVPDSPLRARLFYNKTNVVQIIRLISVSLSKEFEMKRSIMICILTMLTGVLAYGDYSVSWYTIDGGGGTSAGGVYSVTGSLGQADAIGASSGGDYTLSGGFWPGDYSCVVNLVDLSNLASYWLDSGPGIPADLNDDGIVDDVDLSDLAYYWLDYCPAGWGLK